MDKLFREKKALKIMEIIKLQKENKFINSKIRKKPKERKSVEERERESHLKKLLAHIDVQLYIR